MATIQETVNQFVQQNPVLANQLRDLCIQFGVFQPTATQPSTPVASTAPAPAPAAPAPVQPSVPPVVRVLFDEHASTAPIAEQVAQAEATAEPIVETAEPEVESETSEEAEAAMEDQEEAEAAMEETAEPDVESETSEEAEAAMAETADEIPHLTHRDVVTEDLQEPPFEEEAMDDVGEMVEVPAPGEFTVEQFMEIQRPESHYVVTFDIDQRDADDITVSSYQSGKLSKEELIKLSILAHYNQLSDYDGGWWSLRPLDDFLEEYLQGNFYDQCNRFKVNDIEIHGYNADTNQFYTMDIPELDELGIVDIDEAYHQYFGGDECDPE